ncbi:hypothetical protein AR685_16530 [Chryseobacterium sp. JAH]|nr:hypothetical protein AR685_16530 [Chryseobacterium sp. JAH]
MLIASEKTTYGGKRKRAHPKSSNRDMNAITKKRETLIIGKKADFTRLSRISFLSRIKGMKPIIIGTRMMYVQELISTTLHSTKTLKNKAYIVEKIIPEYCFIYAIIFINVTVKVAQIYKYVFIKNAISAI